MKIPILVCIFMLVLVLVLPLTGCIESGGATKSTTPVVTVTDQTQNTEIGAIKTTVGEHTTKIATIEATVNVLKGMTSVPQGASAADIAASNARITALETANSKLRTDLDALVTWKNSLPATTPIGTTPTVPTTGAISVSTSPSAIQIMGGSQYCYTMRITNGTATWQYVKPILTLSTSVSTNVSAIALSMGWGSFNMTGVCWQFTPLNVLTNSVLCIPVQCGSTNLGEVQVAAGQSVDVLVCVTITSSTPQIWTVSTSLSNRSL